MKRLARIAFHVFELLEARLSFSGATDLAHSTAHLSEGRWPVATTSVAGKAFFAGGGTAGSDSDVIDIYDAATGRWSTAKLTHAAQGVAAVSVDGKALFNEGDVVDIFDSARGRWSTTKPPHVRGGAFFAGAAVGDRAIFVGGGAVASVNRVADVYNARARSWSVMRLPQPLDGAAAVNVGSVAIFAGGQTADIYDSQTGRWSAVTLPLQLTLSSATAVGANVFFTGANPSGASGGNIVLKYDPVTGAWSTAAISQGRDGVRAASVGTKAIFAGGSLGPESSVVDVYDKGTGQWSVAAPLVRARDAVGAVSVGTQALFAGGEDGYPTPDDAVDIYTDTSPAASLSGALAGKAGHKVSVTVFNTGDAALAAGATVGVYASAGRTLDANSVLIGHVTLAQALAAGSSVPVSLPTSIKSLVAGQYHLVAAVDDNSGTGPTPIASQAKTSTVLGHAKAGIAYPFALKGPIHGWPARL